MSALTAAGSVLAAPGQWPGWAGPSGCFLGFAVRVSSACNTLGWSFHEVEFYMFCPRDLYEFLLYNSKAFSPKKARGMLEMNPSRISEGKQKRGR